MPACFAGKCRAQDCELADLCQAGVCGSSGFEVATNEVINLSTETNNPRGLVAVRQFVRKSLVGHQHDARLGQPGSGLLDVVRAAYEDGLDALGPAVPAGYLQLVGFLNSGAVTEICAFESPARGGAETVEERG